MNQNIFFYNIENVNNFLPEIKQEVINFCKKYPIDFDKQKYKILLCNEKINKEISVNWYKVTSYKYLHFFGRVYLDNDIEETVIIDDIGYSFTGKKGTVLFVLNGLEINSNAENANVVDFYIAPSRSVNNFEPGSWNVL